MHITKLIKIGAFLLAAVPLTVLGATKYFPTGVTISRLGTNVSNGNWIIFDGIATTCHYGRVYFDYSSVQGKAFEAALMSSQATGTKIFQLTYIDGQTFNGSTAMCMLEEVVTGK